MKKLAKLILILTSFSAHADINGELSNIWTSLGGETVTNSAKYYKGQQSKLQELGGFLSDECQVSKQIVSFMGDKLSQHSEAAKNIFTKFKPEEGKDQDLSHAYKEYPKGKKEILQTAAKDERYALEDINIAWKALDKLKLNDKELKEMMMTISGTVIIKAKENGGAPQFQYVSSMVTSPSILEALLKGNKSMKVLTCAEDKNCLDISEKDKLIDPKNSFEHKVAEYFDKFRKALKEDEELEGAAQSFLAKSGIAAFKIYETLYQYTKSSPEYEQGIYVEIVAWNILYNYLSDMLKDVKEAANNLQIAANAELKDFKESIENAQKLLAEYEMKDLSRYGLQLLLIKRAENMEKAMSNEIAQMFNIAKN